MPSATDFLNEPQAPSASAFLGEEPQTDTIPSLPLQEIPTDETLSDRIRKFLFEPEGAKTTREAIQGAVQSIPELIKQLPKQAYQGVKFATGGPEERMQVAQEALREGVPMGVQTAEDIQAPFGTPEFLRGAGQMGMMALPGLELARELRAPVEIPREAPPIERPPIQAEAPPVEVPSVVPPETQPAPEVAPPPPVTPAERNAQILERRKGILARKAELTARAANGEQGLEAQQAAVNADLMDPSNPVVHAPPIESPVRHGEFAKPGYTAVETPQEGMGIKQAFSAKGATDILYEKAFEALRTGQDTISGVRDPILARHKAAFDRGEIRSPEDLKIAEEGKGVGGITPEAAARAAVPAKGDLWYQGVSADGVTQWVTHDPKIAADYAKRRGPDAKVNVYTAEQVGANAFADTEGNLMSPQEYAKNNWSTTIQQQGGPEGPRPKPIRTISIEEAEAPVQAPGGVPVAETPPEPYTPEAAAARAAGQEPVPGIANKYIEQQIEAGTLPEEALVAGTGTNKAASIATARAALAKNPGAAFEAARRVNANQMQPNDPALLHAYSDQLNEGAAQARKASMENPADAQLRAAADAAEQANLNFLQNVLPKAKGQAQVAMVGFQGAVPADLSTFAGMQKELQTFNGGKELSPPQRMQLYQREKTGQRLKGREQQGLDRMQREIDRTLPRTKIPTREQMQASMEKFVERVTPCS